MGTQNLHKIFNPESVAVIGASIKKGSVGLSIMENLLKGGFSGSVTPINPKYESIMGKPCLPSIEKMKHAPDMVVVAAPIKAVPEIIASCGQAGVAGAVVISSGGKEVGAKGRMIEAEILKASRKYKLRVIGPNCLGIINTSKALNASFSHLAPLSGDIAFISQSGAVCTSVLDLANREKIGFSHVVSLGSMMDVDFADVIDYLGNIGSVKSIVMYMENMTSVRNFMSAARAVSRIKPIIVLKSGRSKTGAKAAASHTGALVGDDAVYDTAFKRAGVLRVQDFEELLDCTKFLTKVGRPTGSGLTIITNAGGPGVMAADALESYGIKPSALGEDTMRKLNRLLPENWSGGNPVDILGDTDPDTYIKAVEICSNAPETDALLLLCSPVGTLDMADLAQALVSCLEKIQTPVFTAWIGHEEVQAAREVFTRSGIASFDSPERAVRAFKNLYQYGRNIESLVQIPVRTDKKLLIDRPGAERIVRKAAESGSTSLTEIQAKNVLYAYGIPVNTTRLAESAQAAVSIAEEIGYPVVLKICSAQILHKSDCNGVQLDLKTPEEVRSAFQRIIQTANDAYPDAEVEGVSVQHYHGRADYELIIGSKTDPDFGPVIVFGQGGMMTEILKDSSMGLPPLNRILTRQMIEETRISKVLKGYRNLPQVSLSLLEELLIRISRMITDFPEITELDINPLMVKNGSMLAVDARILISKVTMPSTDHLIISPYPWQYEKTEFATNGQEFFIRPIRPSDADLLIEHFYSLSPKSVYMRFFTPVKDLSKSMLIKLTQVDYDRQIALVALMGKSSKKKMVGVCRIILEPDRTKGEFAMAISDTWQGKGIGSALLKQCLKAAQSKGVKNVNGVVLSSNKQMLLLGKKLGFDMELAAGGSEYELNIDFNNMYIE